jgi:tetratricopeptide (TPR) repeat protein
LCALLWLALLAALSLPARAAPQPSTPSLGEQLTTLYHQVGSSFWRGEYGKRVYIDGDEDWRTLLSTPLPRGGSAWKEYSRAAQAGDEWLKLADENHIHNWMSDTVIYLDALSHYTLGNYARAIELFNRLPHDYLRYRYLSDSNNRDPDYANPSWPGISKLLFFARLQTLSPKPANAFAALKQITADALTALAAQRAFAALIASHSTRYNTYEFREEFFGGDRYGGEPDQWRAAALPPTLALVQQAWDKLLPLAVRADARGVRSWLQSLARSGGLLETVAADHLDELTTLLTAQLKRDVNAALAAKQYDQAKTLIAQLRREYSDDAQLIAFADEGINKVTLGYKTQGEATFDLNHFRPQTEALENFRKMLEVAPTPLLKGYAHFRIADALGTMSKYTEGIEHLKQAIALWKTLQPADLPAKTSDFAGPRIGGGAPLYYIEDATYYLGFYTGAGLKQRAAGIALQQQFVAAYPQSKWVDEALWDCFLWSRWSGHKKAEIAFGHELIEKRPRSVRSDNARGLLKELEN